MNCVTRISTLSLVFFCAVFFVAEPAHADKICIKKKVKVGKGDKVTLTSVLLKVAGTCPKGSKEVVDTSSFVGPAGTQGAVGETGATGSTGATGATGDIGSAGVDGSIRIYGNGSVGALVVSSGTTTITEGNQQYTDISIAAGATLAVPSGTVIRCTGTLDNSGTIRVASGGSGAFGNAIGSNTLVPAGPNAAAGLSGCIAANGAYGTSAGNLAGGYLGCGIPVGTASQIFHPGIVGGGGGGSGASGAYGGNGGGTLTVLCRTAIMNSGTITANAPALSSGGGGGGGVVILASPGSVKNNGTIDVSGRSGGSSGLSWGAGGGGGGGFVHFISPSITTTGGTVNVAEGAAGTAGSPGSVSSTPRRAGGAGGDGFGAGGHGGDVSSFDDPGAASSGSPGLLIQTTADPTSLF